MSYRDTELEVIRWAEARSIIQHSTPLAQARKTLEEAGELLEAAAAMQALKDAGHDGLANLFLSNYRDALGDVLVTLVVGAATADVDLVDCFKDAYNEIKDRKGHLRADGVFVKEQP